MMLFFMFRSLIVECSEPETAQNDAARPQAPGKVGHRNFSQRVLPAKLCHSAMRASGERYLILQPNRLFSGRWLRRPRE
jgi:hypothetical protein